MVRGAIIDNNLKNIRLFISGSHIGMMKDLLEEKNALYGRFDISLSLKELNYVTAAEFYKSKSVCDKIAIYSVFGGSLYINSALDEKKILLPHFLIRQAMFMGIRSIS